MIQVKGVRVLRLFGVEGIVLYPFVLFASSLPDPDVINHERIHLDQMRRDGLFFFYTRYLKEYFQGRLKGLPHNEAYREISYEREAYQHQRNHHYAVKKIDKKDKEIKG